MKTDDEEHKSSKVGLPFTLSPPPPFLRPIPSILFFPLPHPLSNLGTFLFFFSNVRKCLLFQLNSNLDEYT